MTALRLHYRSFLCMALIAGICLVSFVAPICYPSSIMDFSVSGRWGIVVTAVAVLSILAMYFEFERAAGSAKEIALVSLLGTASAVFRLPFAPIPSVQPCTYLVICTGYVFGPVAGFTVGAITAVVSNFFLGQGPWTLFQVFSWGLIGVLAGLLGHANLSGRMRILVLVVFGVFSGYLFGAVMSLYYWASFDYPLTFRTFLAREATGIWFDTLHAIGNVLFLWFLGGKTILILERFKRRFRVFYAD